MSPKPSELQVARAQDGHKANADSVIRYSREFLLECAKSPLVERPEALPPRSVWFGEITKEEPEASNSGRKLASNKPVSADRIVLGPPKMSFASSSFGGLKKSEDSLSGFKKTLDNPRENRSPRGPPSALEQGFGRETIEKLSSHRLPKVTPKDITGLLSGMDRRRVDSSRLSSSTLTGSRPATSSTGSRINTATRASGQPLSTSSTSLNSSNNAGIGLGSKIQRSDAPEWMSYNPESEVAANEGENNAESPMYVDDIQAWKARMKEHERREKEKESSSQIQRDIKEPRVPSRADSSSSWRSSVPPSQSSEISTENKRIDEAKNIPVLEKPLGRTLLSGEPIQDIDIFFSPGGIDLTKPFDSSSAFDKFLSQHTVAVSSFEESGQQKPTRKADGSRFARFFAEDEPEPVKQKEQTTHTAQDMPGRQLSLDQLFQAHSPNSTATAPPPPPPLGRMPSEAEILESMKVNKSPIATKTVDNSEESADAFGFSKIMAALSKPPVGNADSSVFSNSTNIQLQAEQAPSSGAEPALSSIQSSGTAQPLQDPSIVTFQSKPTLLDTLLNSSDNVATLPEPSQSIPSTATSESSHTHGPGATTATASSSTPSSDTSRPASRPVQVAFGGGIPTSVYRQLSGKTEGQKSASPLIRPLSSVNGMNANGGSSPSLSSPSAGSPRQFNPQATVPTQQPQLHQQQPSSQTPSNIQQSSQLGMHQQQQSQQAMNKNFGPYNQGPGPVLHSPVMDPRMSGMYGNGGPSPMSGHGHVLENEPPAFFSGMSMQRPTQSVPPQFAQQMPPFSQQMHVSGPGGDFMPPHPSQFVGLPPFGAPMHPGMFPMNPVEMLMHRGPGGPPPRPMPGMAGPNHFVPNNFGHPMNGMPHPDSKGRNAYLFGVSSPGHLEAYSVDLSDPSAPKYTLISAITSDTTATAWDSKYSLGCYSYIGDSPQDNSPINVIQFGSTTQALFFPNGTWIKSVGSGTEASVDYVSSKFFTIVGSSSGYNWILAKANPKPGSGETISSWINIRTGSTLEARQDPTVMGSDLLLTVGAIAPTTGDFGNGLLFSFDQSGAGTVFRATGNKRPEGNLTASESMVNLTMVRPVDMNSNSLTADAIPVTSTFAAIILDKSPEGTISIFSIDSRTSTYKLVQSLVSSPSPLFLENQSITTLNSKILVYGGIDEKGVISNSVHIFDVISGTWSGPGLVDPKLTAVPQGKYGGLSVVVIGGIAVGVGVLIAIVCILVWQARRKKAKQLGIHKQQELDSIDKNNKDKMIELLNMENESQSTSDQYGFQQRHNESNTTLAEFAANTTPKMPHSAEQNAHQHQQHRKSSRSQRPTRQASSHSIASASHISLYSTASSIYLVDSPSTIPLTPMVPPAYASKSFEYHRPIQRYHTTESAPSTPGPSSKKSSSYKVIVPDEYDDGLPSHRRNTDEYTLFQPSSITAGSTGSSASFNMSLTEGGGTQTQPQQPEKTQKPKSSSKRNSKDSSNRSRTNRNDAPSVSSQPSSPTSQKYPLDVATSPTSTATSNQSSSSGRQRRTKAPAYPRSKTDPLIPLGPTSPTEGTSKSSELYRDSGTYEVKSAVPQRQRQSTQQSPKTPTSPTSGSTAFSPTSSAFPPSPTTQDPTLSGSDARFTEAFPMPPKAKSSVSITQQRQQQQYVDWHQQQHLIYKEQQRLAEYNSSGFIPQSPKTPKLGSLPRPIPRDANK
ncbi:hypothetical protein BGX27_005520 [Mortierella sp. AM989]|nr:hypothetical protein BGX27_005520 [Mortierella sp. AM989]